MSHFIIPILLILVLLFGISSISASYATAKQAQATIETARAAEIASFSNLVSILAMILLLAAVIVIGVYFSLRFKAGAFSGKQESTSKPILPQSQPSGLEQIATLLAIQMLREQMERSASQLQIPSSQSSEPSEDDFWLLP